jgi:hypothetical protein
MGRKAYRVSLRQPGRRNANTGITVPAYFSYIQKPGCEENAARLFVCWKNKRDTMKTYFTKGAGKGQRIMSRFFLVMMFACLLSLAGYASCFATTVGLQWDAVADPGLIKGYKVYYRAGSSEQPFPSDSSVSVDKTLTTTNISGLDPAHAYYFAVISYDDSGLESSYSNIAYVPEQVPPTTSITSPTNYATVSGTVSINASASDNVGVTKVEFYLNGALVATDTTTPYVYSWNTSSLAAGVYTMQTKAYDAAGNVGQSSIVTVTVVVNDTTPPKVAVTSPANYATVSGTVTITASATDNVGVSYVEFYENGALLTATNVAPYSYSWNTTKVANGSYTLTAKAYDASNNVGQSATVNVTVSNVIYNQEGTGSYYSSLQQAYDNASDGATLLVLGIQLNESIVCTQAKSVKIIGGYDQAFTSNNGYTTLHGKYILGPGKIVLNRLKIN